MTTTPKLTPRQREVYDALTSEWQNPSQIAKRAYIHTTAPRETASHHCIALVKLGLAERNDCRAIPMWRRKPEASQ